MDSDNSTTCAVARLQDADIEPTARMLARAFADNPCYAFMHPRTAQRAADLVAFFERNLRWHRPLDLTWVAKANDGTPIGTVTLEPPLGVVAPKSAMFRHWVVPTLRHQGWRTLRRTIEVSTRFGSAHRDAAGGRSFWHVHAVAVEPAHQNHGVGKQMLRTVFRELDEQLLERCPAPVVLSTQRERNVQFYHQFGFDLVAEFSIGPKGGFRTWCMRR